VILWEVLKWIRWNEDDCLDLEMEIGIEEFERNLVDLRYCTLFFSVLVELCILAHFVSLFIFHATHQHLQTHPSFLFKHS